MGGSKNGITSHDKTLLADLRVVAYNNIPDVTGALMMANQDDNNVFDNHRIQWEFFKLHANQRLTFFRYYIGLLVAIFVAYFYVYDHLKDCHGTLFLYICLILAGLSISMISYLFYSIDLRNVELIENAKKALKEIEYLSNNNSKIAFKHKKIFGVVFTVTIITGILLSIIGGYKLGLDTYCNIPMATAQSPNNKVEKPGN